MFKYDNDNNNNHNNNNYTNKETNHMKLINQKIKTSNKA